MEEDEASRGVVIHYDLFRRFYGAPVVGGQVFGST